jgi:hypothetical protein
VGLPPQKLSSFLHRVKDHLALKMPNVYSIPCVCRKVYIRQTEWSIETRVKEYHLHISLEHPEKSAIAEHSINLGHHIQLRNNSILAKSRYMEQIIGELIQD